MNAKWVPSPNYSSGRSGFAPIAIVVHIMQGTIADTDSWFSATQSEVSAHFGIARSGAVHQYVAEGNTAWHAGRVNSPTWTLIKPGVNPNLYTLGIEHEGQSGTPWTDALYEASSSTIAELATRWSIPLDRQHVIGHHEIYALKPFCPGGGVDLDTLIALARDRATDGDQFTFVDRPSDVITRSALNVRQGVPTTHAPAVRVIPPNTEVASVGWTSNGEAVHGNAHWYRDGDGNYLWAGATDKPIPQ